MVKPQSPPGGLIGKFIQKKKKNPKCESLYLIVRTCMRLKRTVWRKKEKKRR
jgi:hypothetical protein